MPETLDALAKIDPLDPQAVEALTTVFEAYNQTTERLQRAHVQLQGEVARLRDELQHKNELLERKSRLAALGEMAAGMAHEIRNPLGGIQLYASLLDRHLEGQTESSGWVKRIRCGVRHLDQIVNDILSFTQNVSPSKTIVELNGLLADIEDYARPHLQTRQVTLCRLGVPVQFELQADVNLLQRALLNLILNAIEATAVNSTVFLKAERSDGKEHSVSVSVRDEGPGVPADLMGKIFDPFFTTRDTGVGLGLAIVHRLIECQSGAIQVANASQGGAIFTILLP